MRIAPLLIILFAAAAAQAASVVPGPADAAHDPALTAKMLRLDRQYNEFNARQFGVSLDAFIPNVAQHDVVRDWLNTNQTFEDFSGQHPYDIITVFGEHGDLGNFGGFASAGDCWRYMALRDGGGDPADIAAARARVVELLEAWHVYTAITGVPGVYARGIRRMTSADPTDPPMPDGGEWADPNIEGHPDYSGQFPEWEWMGDTSKDQAIGYAVVLGALWDAIADDSSFAQSERDRMHSDALALAGALMTEHRIGGAILGQDLDMIITDQDGAPVTFFGLNPRVLAEPSTVVGPNANIKNGFNALLGLGFMKVLHHITGDAAVGAFYYEQLVDARGWPSIAFASGLQGFATMYLGKDTNFSNVNMAALAMYNLVRYERDPALLAVYQQGLEDSFYRPGKNPEPAGLKQSWFDLLYTGFRAGGTDDTAVSDAIDTLSGWPDAPLFSVDWQNCDAAEIASGNCIALDGTPLTIWYTNGNQAFATEPVPMALRPPNNFEWRSSPFRLNAGPGSRLNPGGDFRGAYWLGRMLQRSANNNENLSPVARDRSNGWPIPGVDGGPTPDGGSTSDGGPSGGDASPGDTRGDPVGGDSSVGGDGGGDDAAGTGGSGGSAGAGGTAGGTGGQAGGAGGAGASAGSGGSGGTPGNGCGAIPPANLALILIALFVVLRRRDLIRFGNARP